MLNCALFVPLREFSAIPLPLQFHLPTSIFYPLVSIPQPLTSSRSLAMPRVVLAMSGGVDSSVAAYLLRAAGHDVLGVFMRHGESSPAVYGAEKSSTAANAGSDFAEGAGPRSGSSAVVQLPVVAAPSPHKQGCCSASDAEDARRVADKLAIPFYAINFEREFGRIMDYFVDEYTAARTPNPCVVCNNWLKFGKLFEYADSVGAEYVATGHYARLETGGPIEADGAIEADEAIEADGAAKTHKIHQSAKRGVPVLLRGVDGDKDQSYVLFGVQRRLLSRMLLPVGGYHKAEIRRLAAQIGLRVAEKRDSQEICFVTSGRYDEFVRRRRPEVDTSGELVTTDGQVVGHHDGVEGFTIGQRKGLGVALGEPRFVVRIEPNTRRVVIGQKQDLARGELTADRVNWLVERPISSRRCLAQIRYNSRPASATVEPLGDARIRVRFDEPRYGVAPGQAVVCYEGEHVLGGGWIE